MARTSRFAGLVGLAVVVAIAGVALGPPASATPTMRIALDSGATAVSAPVAVRVGRVSAHTLRVSWSPVDGATSYRMLGRAKGEHGLRLRAIAPAGSLQWIHRGLRTGRPQVYRVQACVAGRCGALSRSVWARPTRVGARWVNAGRIRYVASPHALGLREDYALRARALPGRTAVAGRGKRTDRRLRYVSMNPAVATVSKTGVVNRTP